MVRGVLAALAATILYNLSVVIQKKKAQQASTSGLRLVAFLATKPLWLFGVGLQTAGLAFHFFALTKAPVTVVQPVIAAGVVFVAIFAALLLGERPGRQELAGMATAMSGVTVLLATIGEPVVMKRVRAAELSAAIVALAVLIALLLAATAWRRVATASMAAAFMGVAAGLAQGMSDAMNRLMGAWLSPGDGWVPTAAIGGAAAACLLAFGVVGLVVTQNALRLYRANTVVPCMLTAQLLVPVGMATALYGQALPSGIVPEMTWLAAFVLVIVGVVALSTSTQVASKFVPPT